MKKALLFLMLSSLSTFANAERFKDVIHSFSEGQNGEEHLLYLNSGRVVYVQPDFGISKSDLRQGERVELKINRKQNLVAISSLGGTEKILDIPEEDGEQVEEKATVLPDYSTANSIFSGMNRSYKSNTECTDRAHVWAYEEWKKHGLISKKVFLFFTNTYIRRYRYNWWFHVSPYTLVQDGESTIDYVMDRRYTRSPFTMKSWTDVFIRSKKTCTERTYRYYRSNKNSPEHCYIVKSEMYYRLPLHVRNLEDSGIVKTRFSTSEVNFSYRAFTRRGAR